MHHKIATLIFDMYGVILKERTGNFIPYTFEHFEKAEHERIKDLIENQKLFTKAGLGELSSAEFLSLFVAEAVVTWTVAKKDYEEIAAIVSKLFVK